MIYNIGLCQFRPTLLKKQKNLDTMWKMVEGIKADLIVFPELSTSGYVFNSRDEVFSIADDFEKSDTTAMFLELSKENDTSYVIGFPEKSDNFLYNSCMLINPDGSKYLYRKTHLFNEEKQWFEPGNLGFVVAKGKKEVNIGLMICFDWMFPESARTLMLKGATIIAHPSALVLPWCQQAMLTRSLENRIFSITANRIGTEINGEKEFLFTGMSQAVSPLGEILFRLEKDDEKVQIVEIDTDKANEKNPTPFNNIITDRKPEYYI
ncbi:MAG: beta-ureidopropionase [Candidatus Cloacimonetes bacterium]|nr:beta-ureidopropionase [Candidatus Cloacimonadota bacterium]